MNLQWSFSQLLFTRAKTKEASGYELGTRGVADAGEEVWLVVTKGAERSEAAQRDQAECAGEGIGPRSARSQLIGTIAFSRSE